MDSNVLKPGDEYRENNQANALHFLVNALIHQTVNVAIPVRVDSVTLGDGNTAGWVSATPLITDRDLHGNMIKNVSIPKLPFFRYRAGTAAVILNPRVGDVGLAVFCHKDISPIKPGVTQPQNAGSYRTFDYSDGVYIGGLFGEATPKTTIVVDPDGELVEVNCKTMVVNAPTITLNGMVNVTKDVTATGEVTGKGINLSTHVHPCGDHNSGPPQ